LALKALTYLVDSPDDLDSFLAVSGLDPAELRARAGEPEMLTAVLDFLLADDARVLGFCRGQDVDPRLVHAARYALGGP